VTLPDEDTGSDGITKLWARKRLDDMVREDWFVASKSVRDGKQVTRDNERFVQFALDNGIMSQWTSFVAVEKRVVNIGGKMRTVRVPVEMADGVSYEGISGGGTFSGHYQNNALTGGRLRGGAAGGGFGGGGGGGRGSFNPPATKASDPKAELDALRMQRNANPELKLHKSLRDKKTGKVEVQVLVRDWPEGWKAKLEAAGFKVEGSEKDLKVVFGVLDMAKAMELVKLEFVDEVRLIE
jgi:Ca-activated chloride channel family protein